LFGKPDQRQPQGIIVSEGRVVMQGTAGQTNNPAGLPLRCRQLLACMENRLTKIRSRQALGFK